MISSAMSSAVWGMNSAVNRLDASASRVAGAGASGDDLAQPLVGALSAKDGYDANLKVLKVSDDMMGTLLDMIA